MVCFLEKIVGDSKQLPKLLGLQIVHHETIVEISPWLNSKLSRIPNFFFFLVFISFFFFFLRNAEVAEVLQHFASGRVNYLMVSESPIY